MIVTYLIKPLNNLKFTNALPAINQIIRIFVDTEKSESIN